MEAAATAAAVERTTTTTMTTATTTMGSPAGGLRHREGTWRQTGGRAPAFARRESRQSQGRTYQCADSILRTTRRGDTNHAASRSRPRMHSSSARLSPTLPLSARARPRGPFHFQSSPFSFSDFFFCFFSLFSFLSPSRLAFLSVPPYLSCSTCETCSFQRCCSFCCFSSIFPARCNFAFRAAGDTVSRGISLSLSSSRYAPSSREFYIIGRSFASRQTCRPDSEKKVMLSRAHSSLPER